MIDMGIPGKSGNEDFGGISGSARGLFFLENHQPGNCSCSTYANSANGTTSPQPSQSFVTDWYFLPTPSPNGDISSRSCHRGPQRRTGSRHNRHTRLPSTIYSALLHTEKKKGVRDAMDHEWPDRVCSHVTVGERNKTGLNSAGGRCWTTQGEEKRRHKSPPDKKKEEPNCCPLDLRQKFMHLYTWIISAD